MIRFGCSYCVSCERMHTRFTICQKKNMVIYQHKFVQQNTYMWYPNESCITVQCEAYIHNRNTLAVHMKLNILHFKNSLFINAHPHHNLRIRSIERIKTRPYTNVHKRVPKITPVTNGC